MASWARKLHKLFDPSDSEITDAPQVADGTESQNSTTSHSTQASWTDVATLDTGDTDHWKECRPYVVDRSGGGSTTDARLIAALDPSHAVADAPTGALSDGDGWIIVDDVSGMASGGDWPDIAGSGYEVDTHLLVLQVKQGSGQETIDGYLTADRAK